MAQFFDFYYYPFDTQTMTLKLTVEGTNITNCRNSETEGLLDSHYPLANMGLTMANAARKLLGDGATTSWKLDPAKGINAIVADHGVVSDEDSSIAWDVCVISIYIRRNYVVFLVKYLMITILVVMGAILTAQSLYAEDLTGDRCAILYIAFLILVTNMQSDLELGHLTSMIWIDIFNVSQLILVMLSVGVTMLVHRLQRHQRDTLGKHIDMVSDFAVPLVFYPIVTLGTILVGTEAIMPGAEMAGLLLMGIGMPVAIAISIWRVKYNLEQMGRQQLRAIYKFRKSAHMDSANYDATTLKRLMMKMFFVFDADGSGEIDARELRLLMSKAYFDVPEEVLQKIIFEMRQFADSDGRYDDANFIDALQYANRKLNTYLTANDNAIFGDGTGGAPTPRRPRLAGIKIALKIGDSPEIAHLKKAMQPSVDAKNIKKRLEGSARSRANSASQAVKRRCSAPAQPAAAAPTGFSCDSTRASLEIKDDINRDASTDGVRDVLQATMVTDLRDTMRDLQSTMRDLCHVLQAQQRELSASDVTLTASVPQPDVAEKAIKVEAALARQAQGSCTGGNVRLCATNVETVSADQS